MFRPLAKLLVALTLGAAACSLGTSANGDDATITVAIEIPDQIDWRRTIAGIEIAGSGTEPDPAELALLDGALSELPAELLKQSEVRTIYRVVSDPEAGEGEALAFARGPDVYLTDGTFAEVHGRFEMAKVLAHELTHAAQFAALSQADLEVISELSGVGVYSVTEFVGEFARNAGWVDAGSADNPQWQLVDSSGTTSYGATLPSEDMAESVSLVALGRAGALSKSRIEWVEDFLNVTAREMARGKPYLPPGAVAVAPATPLYDEERAARLSPGVTEPRSWALPSGSPDTQPLAKAIQDELGRRGLGGTLRRSDDDAVARYTGEFVRGDGVRFLVELWDFRDAPGFRDPPEQPVLTYVALY